MKHTILDADHDLPDMREEGGGAGAVRAVGGDDVKMNRDNILQKRDQLRALKLLDEIERWDELGIEEFIPEFSRKRWRSTIARIARMLDRVLGPKQRRTK